MDEALKKSGEYPNIAMPPGKRVHAATGEPVEVPEWAHVGSVANYRDHVADIAWCSVCRKPAPWPNDYNYCPGCGKAVKQ